jgi:hypothetical protein
MVRDQKRCSLRMRGPEAPSWTARCAGVSGAFIKWWKMDVSFRLLDWFSAFSNVLQPKYSYAQINSNHFQHIQNDCANWLQDFHMATSSYRGGCSRQ